MYKIAFYGKTGSGKSTVAKLAKDIFISRNLSIDIIKFAEPLYYIQKIFYEKCGMNIEYYSQNQILLENIANWMRMLNPRSLVQQFDNKLKNICADVVINDDVRDAVVDIPYLKEKKFYLFHVLCQENIRIDRLNKRNDISTVAHSVTTEGLHEVKPDFIIDTSSDDIESIKNQLKYIIDIINSKGTEDDDIDR